MFGVKFLWIGKREPLKTFSITTKIQQFTESTEFSPLQVYLAFL